MNNSPLPPKTRVYLEISDGVLQQIYTNDKTIEFVVCDYDNLEYGQTGEPSRDAEAHIAQQEAAGLIESVHWTDITELLEDEE
jgi:hypothetical protein